jgi:hypothetical protein
MSRVAATGDSYLTDPYLNESGVVLLQREMPLGRVTCDRKEPLAPLCGRLAGWIGAGDPDGLIVQIERKQNRRGVELVTTRLRKKAFSLVGAGMGS